MAAASIEAGFYVGLSALKRMPVKDLFAKVKILSGASGGAWCIGMFAYSDLFDTTCWQGAAQGKDPSACFDAYLDVVIPLWKRTYNFQNAAVDAGPYTIDPSIITALDSLLKNANLLKYTNNDWSDIMNVFMNLPVGTRTMGQPLQAFHGKNMLCPVGFGTSQYIAPTKTFLNLEHVELAWSNPRIPPYSKSPFTGVATCILSSDATMPLFPKPSLFADSRGGYISVNNGSAPSAPTNSWTDGLDLSTLTTSSFDATTCWAAAGAAAATVIRPDDIRASTYGAAFVGPLCWLTRRMKINGTLKPFAVGTSYINDITAGEASSSLPFYFSDGGYVDISGTLCSIRAWQQTQILTIPKILLICFDPIPEGMSDIIATLSPVPIRLKSGTFVVTAGTVLSLFGLSCLISPSSSMHCTKASELNTAGNWHVSPDAVLQVDPDATVASFYPMSTQNQPCRLARYTNLRVVVPNDNNIGIKSGSVVDLDVLHFALSPDPVLPVSEADFDAYRRLFAAGAMAAKDLAQWLL